MCMVRTTLAIEDSLLRRLKQKAARDGRTLQDVTNEILRRGLTAEARATGDYRLELETWDAEVLPGVDLDDRSALLDLMERDPDA